MSITKMERERPPGLVIFAVIHFIMAGFVAFGLISALLLLYLKQPPPLAVSSMYSILSPIFTLIFLVLSGIGFLKLSWGLGYVTGNIVAGGSLLNYLAFHLMTNFKLLFATSIPMLYFCILLAFLNLRFKKYFTKAKL